MINLSALRMNAHFIQILAVVAFIWLFTIFAFRYHDYPMHISPTLSLDSPGRSNDDNLQHIRLNAQYFLDYPLQPPYKNVFGELGQRAQLLRTWIDEVEGQAQVDDNDTKHQDVAELVSQAAVSLFPYLKPIAEGKTPPPLANIRSRLGLPYDDDDITKAPAGIVIPTGEKTLRFACHLIASLTRVHKTKLPIQVVYAGDQDLTASGRKALQDASSGTEIEMLDILTIFDDATLKLETGGWAIKPFAALASRFEQVILLDADAVFLQDPSQLLLQDRYREAGVLLFHDRLLWKGGFPDRHNWWHEQIKHPSTEANKSLVWTERYSEEGDSGVVVVDKTRLDVLIGLLHIGWQNSHDVREEVTYKITYGDKETYWIGFEATGSKYSFSPHYGGIVGWLRPPTKKQEEKSESKRNDDEQVRVCSFVIAHVDQKDRLLWYNGGLLKNKAINQTEFEVPTHWMIDQTWHKGGSKKDMSCMAGDRASEMSGQEKDVLEKSINVAMDVDEVLTLV